MAVDLQQAAWLKSESLDVLVAPTGGIAWSASQSNDVKFTSPIDARADALTEGARTIAMLRGPIAKERIIVKGRRRDLLFKCVLISFGRLGYAQGANANELVSNGTFTGTLSGWSGINATLALSSNALQVTPTASGGFAVQQVTGLTVGQPYRLFVDFVAATGGNCKANIGTTQGGAEYGSFTAAAPALGRMFKFIASASSVFINLTSSNPTGWTSTFDNVSLKLDLGRAFVIGVAENENNTTTLTVIRSLA